MITWEPSSADTAQAPAAYAEALWSAARHFGQWSKVPADRLLIPVRCRECRRSIAAVVQTNEGPLWAGHRRLPEQTRRVRPTLQAPPEDLLVEQYEPSYVLPEREDCPETALGVSFCRDHGDRPTRTAHQLREDLGAGRTELPL